MAHTSFHPELNQPVPRQVKMKASTVAAYIGLTFGFIIVSCPVFFVVEKSINDAKFHFISLIILIAPLFALMGIFSCLSKCHKERRLLVWGNIAEAKTYEGPDFPGKIGRFMDVFYEFKDTHGNSIEGTQRYPSRNANWKNMESTLEKLDHPVVLYDPNNSNKNMLYPGFNLVCLPPKQR